MKSNKKEEIKRKLNLYKNQMRQLQQEQYELENEIKYERKSLATKLKMEFLFNNFMKKNGQLILCSFLNFTLNN
jgi:uncharacterized protein YlxW (UPF0749 family)